jgi:prolyl-tRNA synthetase
MRLSQLFFKTFKEAPAEADIISHQLLERAGYIKRLGRGLYSYTPLMWRVIKKLKNIICEELDRAGAQEVHMPLLHPDELWKKSGRWDEFKSTNLLYTLKDREGHEYCLAPTHEEAITALVSNWLTSYKQLPVNLYQITSKFRDEIRPRFGLMRAKEFIMKDAYAFCASEESMDKQYHAMRAAYQRIFDRLELDYVIVSADGGKIGKGKSEEFQVKAAVGEDIVMTCADQAYNLEAAIAIPPQYAYKSELLPLEKLSTPNITSVDQLVRFTDFAMHHMVKTIIYKLTYLDRVDFIAIGIRGDRQVNEVKINNLFAPLDLALATDEEIKAQTGSKPGFAGPLHSKIKYYADNTCKVMTNFLCGGNQEDVHYFHVNWERDCPLPPFHDFLLAQEGDSCPHVSNGVYKAQRGIEVGHIFNLGTKYSQAMEALFQDENGKTKPFWMGCYGIGVGRTAAACIEQRHDEKGIKWPKSLAPYQVTITAASTKDPVLAAKAEEIYQTLSAQGIEALIDDRNERLGFKLKDSDLIGIPFKVIVGNAFTSENRLEIEPRTGDKFYLPSEDILQWAKTYAMP